MHDNVDPIQWLHRLHKRLTALDDTPQRVFLLTEDITELDPDDSAQALETILTNGFYQRDRASKLSLESALLSLAWHVWPESHRLSTLQSADELSDQLSSIYLAHTTLSLANDADEQFKVPPYNATRPLSLGERRSLASQPNRRLIGLAVLDPHPMVIEKLLINPKLKEDDVITMATRRPAPASALVKIAQSQRWRPSRRVAQALIYNPALPDGAALTLLPSLTTHKVTEIARDTTFSDLIRQAAVALLRKKATLDPDRPI